MQFSETSSKLNGLNLNPSTEASKPTLGARAWTQRSPNLHSSSLVIPSPSIASKVFRPLFLFFWIPVNYSRGDLLLGFLGNLTIDLKLN